jgi:hypothetical protein
MNRIQWVGFVVALAACGCTSTSGPPARDPAPPPSQTLPGPAGTAPPAAPNEPPPPAQPACSMSSSGLRLRIDSGQTRPTGTGLAITNEGASHDNFGPDGFDIQVSLHFRRGNEEARRQPSFRDHRPDEVLGHCYRLLDADVGVVLLEVSALPGSTHAAPEPDAPPTLTGVGGTAPPNGAACSVTDDNGPLPGGRQITHGCAPNELCVCEVQAGYSCSGRCALITPK